MELEKIYDTKIYWYFYILHIVLQKREKKLQ